LLKRELDVEIAMSTKYTATLNSGEVIELTEKQYQALAELKQGGNIRYNKLRKVFMEYLLENNEDIKTADDALDYIYDLENLI
jgi:hypothetical protein